MSSNKSNLPIIIITIVITIAVILLIANYQTIFKTVYPPNPVVVSSQFNDSSTRLFEYSAKVEAVIRNDGGNGDIVFEATVYQDGNTWTKTVKKYFESKETSTMELQFDEVKMLGGKVQSQVRAYSFGK
jgi:hypothetical protein